MNKNNKYDKALVKMMALCSAREYCRSDIFSKLQPYDMDYGDDEKIVEQLVKEKFIDEERYAKAFVNDKFNYNNWGKIKITLQLKNKQIPGNFIMAAIETIDEETYVEKLENLLAAKKRTIVAKNEYDMRGKLLRYGLSKGFENELLYKLINGSE